MFVKANLILTKFALGWIIHSNSGSVCETFCKSLQFCSILLPDRMCVCVASFGPSICANHKQLSIWNRLKWLYQWKGINRKQSTRWQHLSRLKASAFFSLHKKISCYDTQQLMLGIGNAIWWVIEPYYNSFPH